MFSKRREEEERTMCIQRRLYELSAVINNECLKNAVKEGKHIKFIDPWNSDSILIEKLIKKFMAMKSEPFWEKYGAEVEDLENNYL